MTKATMARAELVDKGAEMDAFSAVRRGSRKLGK